MAGSSKKTQINRDIGKLPKRRTMTGNHAMAPTTPPLQASTHMQTLTGSVLELADYNAESADFSTNFVPVG